MRPQEYAKAISGAVLAGLGVLYVALSDGVVSAQEWVAVAQAAGAAFAVVWGLPNAPKQAAAKQETAAADAALAAAPYEPPAVPVAEEPVAPPVVAPEHVPDPLTGL